MSNYLKVAGFVRYIKKELVLRVLIGLLITGTYVAQAIMLARGTTHVFAGDSAGMAVMYYIIAGGLIILRAFLVRYSEGYNKYIAGKVKAIIREKIIDKLLLLGPGYQSDKRSGKLQSLLTDGVEYLEPFLINYIPQIFIVGFSVIPMAVYIWCLNVPAGIILTVAVAASLFLPHIMFPFTSKSSIGYWREYAVLNSQYVDTMQGMNTVKYFDAEKRKGEELEADSERFRVKQLVNTRNSLFASGAITLMMAIGTSITTGVAAYACSDGMLGYAGLLNIMFLVIECIRPIGELNNAWHSSYLGLSVSNDFVDIMEEPVKIKNVKNADTHSLDKNLPEINFENVVFKYSSKRESAADGLDFSIASGSTAAFVGESGSGKSTIVNLLLRFYDADEGRITLNGVDIRDYDLEYLRSKIAVVFQNTYLFYGTVMENIRMAKPDATDEEVFKAAKDANAHEFILNLDKGYDTIVGERGANLSGGQRQRLAIARAILKEAPVLIMDEATSSVDAASEELIQQTVEGINGKYTTILIAHRLSTIIHADKIYVLDKGKLAEEGTHRELLERKGVYLKLVEAQKGGGR